MKRRIKGEELSTQNLKLQILDLITKSSYELEYLKIDNKNFGNVILEVKGTTKFLRFTQDRGDVYVEKKALIGNQWNDCLFLSHSKSDGDFYDLLLKAISLYLVP